MRIITGIQKRGTYFRIYIGKEENLKKVYHYQCMDGRYQAVREQMNELLEERQMQIPDDQIYIKLRFIDERLRQHTWSGRESITLHLESSSFYGII